MNTDTAVIDLKVFADQATQLAAIAKKMGKLAPETQALIANAEELAATCSALHLDTVANCQTAGDQLTRVMGVKKDTEAMRRSMVDPINDAVRQINDWFRPYITRLTTTEGLLKGGIANFNAEQERQRKLAESRQQEAADRQAAELLKRAEKHAEAGREHVAKALEEQSAAVMATPVASTAPIKVKGVSTRTTYFAEVTDFPALIKAVAAGAVPIDAIQPNQKVLDQMAKALKHNLNYPGVAVREKASISARAA